MIVKNFLGGSGESANIYLTGLLSTDTVECTSPSGKSLSAVWGTYTVESVSTQCWRIVASEYGTYLCEAERGSSEASESVLVDVATDYTVEMSFLPSGCIAEYLFNDSLEDTSGEGNDLTNSGVTFASSGLSGLTKCGVFNGSSARAYSTSEVLQGDTDSYSFSLWMKRNADTGDMCYFQTSNPSMNTQEYAFLAYTHTNYSDKLRYFKYGSGWTVTQTEYTFTKDVWHHWVMTLNATSGAMTLYLDGVAVASGTTTYTSVTGSKYLYIGYSYLSAYYFNGYMTGLRIYNKVLSASEVTQLYNNGNGI